MRDNIKIWTEETAGYQLLDSGDKKKLEKIGGVKIVRAEPRAWWQPQSQTLGTLGKSAKVSLSEPFEKIIDIGIGNIKAKIKFKSGSKHIGIFPEQMPQWRWIAEKLKIENSKLKIPNSLSILNLFGYTGIASLVAASRGAKVTHVDASKQSVEWARENQKLSGLERAPIRWIVDDVLKFLKKEASRGVKYDAIIMDPPSYGKGPKGEVWKIEEKLPELLKTCRTVLSDKPLFIIFNMYATELSAISVANLLADLTPQHLMQDGHIESGELAIKQQNADRLLPMSIFALWQAK